MSSKKAKVKAIFCAAIEKGSSAERSAYLDKACRGDKKLRAIVEALLKAHYEAKSLLDEPVVGAEVTLGDSPLAEGPGTRIGRYKLLQLIGEGGFGVVYMAEQQKPIRRRVALKIIKLGMDTKQVIARFEAERQALAMMEHPNIAKVLDAGATETGRPYFVMELVKGIPITEYCDKNNLDTRGRLELFIDVCKAVQHAHQKGIIHRDIKPRNVLITLHDGKPVPKIIDFGIAKAMQQRLTEKTLFTEYKRFIGTPAYMSPEQAEMSGLDVDTRSDIYSLGVLLYELLTGSTPLEAKKLRSAAYDEMCRMIRETDPPKPSTRLSTLGEMLAEVAKQRDAQPGELCKIVRGDLDWVVMKTLEKDRTRRYETANELASDIERHLRDEPVVAGPPNATYRVRKFVRRHRTGVLFCITVAAALMIGLSLAIVGFVRANREKERTKTALARAEEQRERAEASLKLAQEAVEEITRAADEQLSVAPTAPQARRLLQQTQNFYGRVLEERSDDPAAREQAGLAYKRLGRIHKVLGNDAQAEQAYRQAVNVFKKLGEDFPEDGMHQVYLFHLMDDLADPLEALGRDKVADGIRPAQHELAKGLVRRFPYHSLYRKMLVEDCRIQDSRQSYEEAIVLFEGLLDDHPSCRYELAMLLAQFSTFLKDEGRPKEADEACRKAEIVRQELMALLPRLPCETRRLHMPWPYFGCFCMAKYKVRITQVGEYQLYLRSARHDGKSNSFYAWIEELADGPGGAVADWYMCITGGIGANFADPPWKEITHFERVNQPVRDSGFAIWQIEAPGDYTITLAPRRDGVAIDAFVFQLAGLPDPEGDGPQESPMTKEKVFLESNGRVVVEAEHFTDRTPLRCSWLVVPGEDAGDTAHINFRGAGYIQALPDMSPSLGQWQILTERGDAQSRLELWDKAIADYSEALAIMPDYVPALTGKGDTYIRSGQWDKAIAHWSKAIELDPNDSRLWYLRGDAYTHMQQWDKAVADYTKAIELDPEAWPYWEHRAHAYRYSEQWDKAIADYSKVIELHANAPYSYDGRGHVYRELQKWSEAISDYSKAIELEPDHWEAWNGRFRAYQELGQPDKALPAYHKAIELDPNNSNHWHRRADAYTGLKQWDKAIADYSKAIELNPNRSYHWGNRARVYTSMRQWDKAIADYSKAIELEPDHWEAWNGRFRAYQELGQPDKALPAYHKAIELDPNNSNHWHRRADAYTELKQWDKAIADYSKAIELNPHRSYHWANRARVYTSMKQWDKALADYSQATVLEPTWWEHWHERGGVYSNMEQWQKAIADYSKAIELEPDRWEAWNGRFRAYQELGQVDKGLAEYTKAIELDPNNWWLWHLRGDAYTFVNRSDNAIADYSQAILLNPNESRTWQNRARVYTGLRQWDKALADYSQAILLEPTWGEHWQERGVVYSSMKQWQKAIADCSKAIELEPDNSDHWHWRGETYWRMKQWDEALADLSRAVSLNPQRAWHWHVRGAVYSDMQRWDEAVADLSKAIDVGSMDGADRDSRERLAEVYRNLGDVLEKMGRVEDAQDAYQKAEEIEDRGQKSEDR